jgi:hypothetical protein
MKAYWGNGGIASLILCMCVCMYVCMSLSSFVGKGLVRSRFTVRVIPKRPKGFIVSEAYSQSKRARGPNPWKVQQQKLYQQEHTAGDFFKNKSPWKCSNKIIISFKPTYSCSPHSVIVWLTFVYSLCFNCRVHLMLNVTMTMNYEFQRMWNKTVLPSLKAIY